MDRIHVRALEDMAHRYIIVLLKMGIDRGWLFSRRMGLARAMVKSLF